MNSRVHCPSCHYRLFPLAVECPVCGLTLARRPQVQPLLFQASALQTLKSPERVVRVAQGQDPVALSAPALGRVQPMEIPDAPALALLDPPEAEAAPEGDGPDSFLPLLKLEVLEALLLASTNGILALLMAWTAGMSLTDTYHAFWRFLLPVHGAVSWAFMMVPVVLAGHSPLMDTFGLVLDTDQPERRMSFSLLHTFSVILFPASFLCMLLTASHRTLAELLSGQEILIRPRTR